MAARQASDPPQQNPDNRHRSGRRCRRYGGRDIEDRIVIHGVLQRDSTLAPVGVIAEFDAAFRTIKQRRCDGIISRVGEPLGERLDMRVQPENFLQHDHTAMRRGGVAGNGRIKRMTILCGQLHHLRHYDTSEDFFPYYTLKRKWKTSPSQTL